MINHTIIIQISIDKKDNIVPSSSSCLQLRSLYTLHTAANSKHTHPAQMQLNQPNQAKPTSPKQPESKTNQRRADGIS